MKHIQNKNLIILISLLLVLTGSTAALAQGAAGYIDHIRTFDSLDMGLESPAGLAFMPQDNAFFVTEAGSGSATQILRISPFEKMLGAVNAQLAIDNPLNITFDSAANRLLLFDGRANELIQLTAAGGNFDDPAAITLTRYQAGEYGLQNPQGMAIDPANGRLLILDSATRQVVIITPDAQGGFDGTTALREGRIARQNLAPTGLANLRGLAIQPDTGNLFLFGDGNLHEISQAGRLLTTFNLSGFNLDAPLALVFAPSGDPTDDSARLNLYITDTQLNAGASTPSDGDSAAGQSDTGQQKIYLPMIFSAGPGAIPVPIPGDPTLQAGPGRIIEFTLTPPPEISAQAAPTEVLTLIKTTDTSQYNPPSPDPSGLAYIVQSNTLMIADGEVNEIPNLFTGDNLFEISLSGSLLSTHSTLDYSNEPTGVAYNPANHHYFISDDTGTRGVYHVNPGPDGQYDTADDSATQTVTEDYGGHDPEGVAFNPASGHLFVIDGLAEEVFEIAPGPDGLFNNVGDEKVNNFDVTVMGLRDPEGIEYNPDNGHLYILSGRDELIAETTLDGTVVRYLDFTAAASLAGAGLAYAPASTNPAIMHLYIVDRAVDNNNDPNENDGKLYEMSLPPLTPNNDPPLVNAGANQTITLPASAALSGSVSDDGLPNPPGATTVTWSQVSGPGSVTFANANSTATTASFSTDGVYVLRLTANDGEASGSDDVQITVNPDPFANQPPVVSAGPDQAITVLDAAVLDGNVTDDGQPNPPGAVTVTWSKVSGPGNVTFANANAVDTTATFSTPGTYLLHLTASDGELAGHDEMEVIVTNPDGTLTLDVRVSVSSDDAEESATGSISFTNPDLEMVFDNGNQTVGIRFPGLDLPLGAQIINAYIQFQVDETPSDPTSLIIEGEASDNPLTFANIANNISVRPRTSASVAWSPPPWPTVGAAGPDQRTPNLAPVIQELVNRPGWAAGHAMVFIITGTGERVAESFNGDAAGAPLLHVDYLVSNVNQPPTANAGPDQSIDLPNEATLNGVVTDDGLPNPPGAVTATWSQVSGPGVVSFGNANAATTTASFSAAGSYVLRLTASDGDLSDTDDVIISVSDQPNQPPTANAGPDQSIDLPNEATLNGVVTDDGLPNPPGAVTATWSQVSGPGVVTFGNANAAATTASFSAAGSYVLRLTASDGALSASDDVNITVSPPPNQPPTANAGPDQSIELPNEATLNGVVTDDGLPNPPGAVTATWSQVSGPGVVTFGNANAATTTASFPAAGSYVLRLTASDGALSASDDINISVSEPPNQPPTANAGADQSIDLPNEAALNGVVTDDGLPVPPGTLTATWSQVSGPGVVTFGNANAATTTASFSAAGSYVLRLTASDGALSASDDINISVTLPPNQPPTANAGPDQSIELPNEAALNGVVTDDGLPLIPGQLTATWSQVSGPGVVSFGNANAATTTASFSAAGSYVLRLTASDGALSASDDINISVAPASQNTLEVRINNGADDAEEAGTGGNNVSLNSSDLELVFDGGGNQTVGLRFTGITVPPGATVTNAYVQFQVDEVGSAITALRIQGEAADNAAVFTTAGGSLSSRPRTSADTLWSPAAWPVIGEAGVNQRTPNLAGIIEEIVNRPGWVSGNALALIITGSGERGAESFNGEATGAPLLHIEYTASGQERPTVEAGPNLQVTLPASAALNGVVTDDGLPNPPGAVTVTWSQFSGPGVVSFGNANAAATTASFSAAGEYVLRLSASDGQLTASDELQVTVLNSGGQLVTNVRVNANTDDAEEGANGVVSINSSDLELTEDGADNQTVGIRFNGLEVPPGATISNAYIQFKVDQDTTVATSLVVRGEAADNAATFNTAIGSISARPRTTAAAAWTPAAWQTVGEAGPNQRTPNLAAVLQEIVNRPGWVAGNSLAFIITGSGSRVAESYNGDAPGAPLLHVEYNVGDVNLPPTANAGPDQSIELPNDATLNGAVTDDGQPDPPGAVTATWSQVSGPGVVTFGNANAAVTTASFPAAGSYVLRLTASDGELIISDDVSITVTPPNEPPTANAGPDQSIDLPNDATLNGAVSDDGLPNPPGAVTATWSQVSGPGAVTFGNANAATTTASFPAAGSYVLRLTASDGALSASDDISISVSEPPNEPPTANAGADQSINLPNEATLNGVVSDDGLPVPPGTLTATWSQVSGPGVVTFGNANAAVTTASFPAAGSYVLRLTASDGAVSASDDVSISVTLPPNQPPTANAGPDQSIELPNEATLNGVVSDDGLPLSPGTLTATWSQVSGPGVVTFGNANAAVTTASFSAAGSYVLRLTASDGALSASDDISISVTPASQNTLEVRINNGADDAEESGTGGNNVSLNSSDLELVFDGGGNQTVGIRFTGITVPPGATVTNAYVQFQVDEVGSAITALRIQGEAADNAAVFTTAGGSISSRPRTSADTLWSPAAWPVIGEAGPNQRTPNLASIIEEIVNRPGWESGNALALIITGSGERGAESFNGEAAGAPLLHIEYTASGQERPTVDAGPDLQVTLPGSAALSGTVTDDGLPNPPGAVTVTWSQFSGPGVVSFGNANALNTTASFSAAGEYVLRLMASDGQLTASDELQVTVLNSGGQLVTNVRVNANTDDAEEGASGVVSINSSDLELTEDGADNQTVGIRFNGLEVPPGATISNAYIQFKVDQASTVATSLVVRGEAADNAATFNTAIGSISARPRTTAAAAWTPAAWQTVGEAGPNQRTPNLAVVLQEIVNRPGWAAGNSLAFIITGSGSRVAESYNGDAPGAPLLHVEYGPGS